MSEHIFDERGRVLLGEKEEFSETFENFIIIITKVTFQHNSFKISFIKISLKLAEKFFFHRFFSNGVTIFQFLKLLLQC